MKAALERAASQLEGTGWAAELCAADCSVVWLSSQLKGIVGEDDDEALGVGEHMLGARNRTVWQRMIEPEAWTSLIDLYSARPTSSSSAP